MANAIVGIPSRRGSKVRALVHAALAAVLSFGGVAVGDTITWTGVKNDKANVNAESYNGTYNWSDNQAPHGDADYVIGEHGIYYTADGLAGGDVVFAGRSLTFTAPRTQYALDFQCNCLSLTVSNLTVSASSNVGIQSHRADFYMPMEMALYGDWRVDGELGFSSYIQHTVIVPHVRFSGSGKISYSGWSYLGYDVPFTEESPDFTGRISFSHSAVSAANPRAIVIANPLALGGDRPEFMYDALSLAGYHGLKTTATMTMDACNFGIKADANAYLEVAEGTTFAYDGSLCLNGGFVKKGAGTLALGGSMLFGADGTAEPDGVNNVLTVREGALEARHSNTFSDLRIVLSQGAYLAFAERPEDTAFADSGITDFVAIEGETVPVSVAPDGDSSAGSFTVALFTLPSARAKELMGRIRLSAEAGVSATLTETDLGNGLVRLAAEVVRTETVKHVVRLADGSFVPAAISADEAAGVVRLVNDGVVVGTSGRHLVATVAAGASADFGAASVVLVGFADATPFLHVEVEGAAGAERRVYAVADETIVWTGNVSVVGDLFSNNWSDTLPAHGGGDYEIVKHGTYKTGTDTYGQTLVFPGRSLTITAPRDPKYALCLSDICRYLTISNFCVAAGSYVNLEGDRQDISVNGIMGLYGDWRIDGDLEFNNTRTHLVMTSYVVFSGTGTITYSGWGSVLHSDVFFYGSSPDFSGRITFSHPSSVSPETARAIAITDPYALGGNRATFMPDALTLTGYHGLRTTETMTFGPRNFGLTAQENAYLQVDEDTTLTYGAALRLNGGFVKKGAGTWAFGGTVDLGADGTAAPDGVNNAVRIEEGAFKPTENPTEIGKLRLTFAEGAELAIDSEPASEAIAETGLYAPLGVAFEGANLVVRFDRPADFSSEVEQRFPLLTVPSAQAEDLMGKLIVRNKRVRHCATSVVSEDVGDGLTRLSLQAVPSGSLIIVR